MKIAIDARFLGPEGTGVGKYVEKLIENLEQLDQQNEYYIILRKANFHLFNPKSKNFKKVLLDANWYSIKEQLLVPAGLSKIRPNLVHFPHFNIPLIYPGRFVVTIHDTTTSEFGGISSTTKTWPILFLKQAAYRIALGQGIRRARKIFTPSEFVKKKLLKTFSLPTEKITVTYEAPDEIFIQAGKESLSEGKEKQVLATYGISKPFILYVGNAFPYKNLDNLLQVLTLIDRKISLSYVGGRSGFVYRLGKKAKDFGIDDRLIVTGFVPNEDLAVLYKLASCFVFPSRSEGFGLPGIEAMASGCPVVCSNIPVFKEVYGEAALYFDPEKPKDIAEKIELIMKNSELKTDLIKKGLEQVKKYSWRKLAKETLKVYKELA